jgi:hypothetical protein
MQGYRRAFVITGFVLLGLGSNLAWQYPRPQALGRTLSHPQAVLAEMATLESNHIRCRPNQDWTDLLVEGADREQAEQALKMAVVAAAPVGPQEGWTTPPALLADLARLPGVKTANVVIHDGREAVVMLAMQHGAFAGDPGLLQQAIQTVQFYQPKIRTENIKLMDGKGSDLNHATIPFQPPIAHPLQADVQAQLDGLLGPRRALFFCRVQRGKERNIHLQPSLYLRSGPEEQRLAAEQLVTQTLQKWVDAQNALLKTDQHWQVQNTLYPYLGEGSRRKNRRSWQLDRVNGITLDAAETREWTLAQRTLPLEESQALQWGLTAPPPTPGQLALGLVALGPALFGWCLAVPWLLRRHQLAASPPG